MEKINLIKNVAIILDFIVSGFAASIQSLNPSLSGLLFGLSAFILFIAVVCVILEIIIKKS